MIGRIQFSCTLKHFGLVEVDTFVHLGTTPGGGPDPDIVEDTCVMCNGKDIADLLSEEELFKIEDQALCVARERESEAFSLGMDND